VTSKDSLVPNIPLARFVARSLGMELTTFGELEALHGVRARTIAVCMDTGELVAFGDRDDDRLIDGAMSSTALPPYLPPWRAAGRRYLDGGVLSKLPLLPAIERGATQIVAINVTNVAGHADTARGMVSIAGYALSLGIEGMTQREVDLARRAGVELRLLDLNAPADVAFWDFAHADRLIAAGRKAAQAWLDESPLQFRSAWRTAVRVRLAWIGGRMERMAGR
jgi:NTE family protein